MYLTDRQTHTRTPHNTMNIVMPEEEEKKIYDPDVIRTRNLLIWSQTRYRCATESHLR